MQSATPQMMRMRGEVKVGQQVDRVEEEQEEVVEEATDTGRDSGD